MAPATKQCKILEARQVTFRYLNHHNSSHAFPKPVTRVLLIDYDHRYVLLVKFAIFVQILEYYNSWFQWINQVQKMSITAHLRL